MFKASLIALASLVSYDAVAWQGVLRHQFVGAVVTTVAKIGALDWSWG
ncbi:MAG TPA: hypothetical protein VGD19_03095 [Allosphingosinicella sp.]|jgi:hypothetical protein